jgi:monofunctional biosynthetic peptidoglycan transglycosylase
MARRRRFRWWWLLVPPAAFLLWLVALWPPPVWYRTHFPAETAFMRMRRAEEPSPRGKEGRREGGRLYQPVTLDAIAPVMALAAITGEDNNFLEHDGIDYAAIRKALGYRRRDFDWDDARDRADLRRALGRAWERRAALRGASTITQQLAKNLYLSSSRNPLRKVKEAVTAYRLEHALGKRRILELYLNVAEMGDDIWGVDAASRQYFRKPASKLSRAEAAALAGLLPFPLRSNPSLKPGRMRWRQQLILRRMAGERLEIPKTEAETPEDTTGGGVDAGK